MRRFRNKKKLFALGRMKSGEKNKTEQRYEDEVLKPQLASGEILWYKFEAVTLKLATGLRYTPDFPVIRSDGVLEFREVKGSLKFMEDDAKAKIKMAEEIFPFSFVLTAPIAKKLGGGWESKVVGMEMEMGDELPLEE